MKIQSLPPTQSKSARVLILGSMPGKTSLSRQEYYSQPRNAFWSIMGKICGAAPELPYDQRILRLQEAGIALWDVLQYCEREGSLDSSISTGTAVPNDFQSFLQLNPTIKWIFFNGQKAAELFQKHLVPLLSVEIRDRIKTEALPSTSPTNTHLSKHKKLVTWQSKIANR
jgi:TDG/mug DNA glycosylase family protein